MAYNQAQNLRVRVEIGEPSPTPWSWTISQGSENFLILRSRPEYTNADEAYEAGEAAARDIAKRLNVKVADIPRPGIKCWSEAAAAKQTRAARSRATTWGWIERQNKLSHSR